MLAETAAGVEIERCWSIHRCLRGGSKPLFPQLFDAQAGLCR
jgi:hypothetical protein